MQKAIIGKKVGMTQIFDEAGKVIPVTVVEAGPGSLRKGRRCCQEDAEGISSGRLCSPERRRCRKGRHLRSRRQC